MKKLLCFFLCLPLLSFAISKGKHYIFLNDVDMNAINFDTKEPEMHSFHKEERIAVFKIDNINTDVFLINNKCMKLTLPTQDLKDLEITDILKSVKH